MRWPLLTQLLAVLASDGSTVDDTQLVRLVLAQLGVGPLVNGSVNLLRLLRSSHFARSNGPHWLVGDDDLGPVLDLLVDGIELPDNDVDALVLLSLVQGLTDAEDYRQLVVQRGFGLVGDDLVRLAKEGSPLGVTDDHPRDASVLELGHGDLTGKGTGWLVVGVLAGDLDVGSLESVLDGEEVQGRWGDDDFDVGVELGVADLLDELLAGLEGSVHLPVTADEELARGCHCVGVGVDWILVVDWKVFVEVCVGKQGREGLTAPCQASSTSLLLPVQRCARFSLGKSSNHVMITNLHRSD